MVGVIWTLNRGPLYVPTGTPYVKEKSLISGRENVCQECGCVRGVAAGLMQVFIAHAARFGN